VAAARDRLVMYSLVTASVRPRDRDLPVGPTAVSVHAHTVGCWLLCMLLQLRYYLHAIWASDMINVVSLNTQANELFSGPGPRFLFLSLVFRGARM
jgi:hypothetical protein